MQFVNVTFPATKEQTLEFLSNNEKVNARVKFEEGRGVPHMKLKEKGSRLKITCEMLGGASKDNGCLVGTYFSGTLTEKDGETTLKGVVVTAPIYHLFLIAFIGVFIYQCIKLSGFSIIPVLCVIMSLFLFKDEFKKQGYIKRYINRAARRIREE